MAPTSFFIPGDNGFMGDQVRGTGFFHDAGSGVRMALGRNEDGILNSDERREGGDEDKEKEDDGEEGGG